ncbi:hypothetical protein [Marinoscillum sp.]|uniref:hypothetical protein n=1 Tax=Marinoscillum sp. TaxID=2024838 RepID=UPI003BAA74B9
MITKLDYSYINCSLPIFREAYNFTGKTLHVVDKRTGQIKKAEVFHPSWMSEADISLIFSQLKWIINLIPEFEKLEAALNTNIYVQKKESLLKTTPFQSGTTPT